MEFSGSQFRSHPNPFEVTLIETKKKVDALSLDPVTFFKSLSDEVRLRSLMLIHYEGELCVCEMKAALDEIRPKVSRHLTLMKKNGLLLDRRQGQWMFYHINPDLPSWAKSVISEATENNVAFIQESLAKLDAMTDRPPRSLVTCQ